MPRRQRTASRGAAPRGILDAPPEPCLRRGPRSTRLNAALIEQAAAVVQRAGYARKDVACAVGVAPRLFGTWLERGRAEDASLRNTLPAQLYRAIEAAESIFRRRAQDTVLQAATDRRVDYRPVLKVLALRFPEDFRPPEAGPARDALGGPFEFESPLEVVRSLEAKVARLLAEPDPAAEGAAPVVGDELREEPQPEDSASAGPMEASTSAAEKNEAGA